MSEERKYIVQVVVIREVEVEAYDELQAEREAFQSLSAKDKGAAIAMTVLEQDKPQHINLPGGALASEDTIKNWSFCRENFQAIDLGWVKG